MSTRDLCTTPIASMDWSVPAAGSARFNWDYDDGRVRLFALYRKGKDKRWDATKGFGWDSEVDSRSVLGAPVAGRGTYLCLLAATRA